MRDNRLVSVEDVLDTLRATMDEYKSQAPGMLGTFGRSSRRLAACTLWQAAGRRAADGGSILRTSAKPAGRLARSRDSRCNTGRC